jgi:hypothetical protein
MTPALSQYTYIFMVLHEMDLFTNNIRNTSPSHTVTADGKIKVNNENLPNTRTVDYIKQGKLDMIIMLPFPLDDISLVRGKTIFEHIGNLSLHVIVVEEYLPAPYNNSKRNLGKNALASAIARKIKSMTGWFLSTDYEM